jgi:hypothetical protein
MPMRNIVRLQLKPSITTRALKQKRCLAQESVSNPNDTKRRLEILGAKYDKTDLPAIVRDNCPHLLPSH